MVNITDKICFFGMHITAFRFQKANTKTIQLSGK
jgi:hypothetical protein